MNLTEAIDLAERAGALRRGLFDLVGPQGGPELIDNLMEALVVLHRAYDNAITSFDRLSGVNDELVKLIEESLERESAEAGVPMAPEVTSRPISVAWHGPITAFEAHQPAIVRELAEEISATFRGNLGGEAPRSPAGDKADLWSSDHSESSHLRDAIESTAVDVTESDDSPQEGS